MVHVCQHRHHRRRQIRRGITLAELLMSSVSGALLLAGLATAVYLSSEAASTRTNSARLTTANSIIEEIAAELRTAVWVRSRTANSIEFDVADRNADGSLETIKYTWSGVAGDNLVRTYNGTEIVLTDRVFNFALSYSTEATTRHGQVLFVVPNSASLTTADSTRQTMLEAMGYYVVPVSDGVAKGAMEAAATPCDTILVSRTCSAANINTKLRSTPIGLVYEDSSLDDDFGLCTSAGSSFLGTTISIVDNSHYITTGLSLGNVDPFDYITNPTSFGSTPVAGTQTLATKTSSSTAVIVVAEVGTTLNGGVASCGRRVKLPWGGILFDINSVNTTGSTILQRSLEWSSGGYLLTRVVIDFQLGSNSANTVTTQADFINRPRTAKP